MKEFLGCFMLFALLVTSTALGAPPVIAVQPEDQSALLGGTALFSVQASGTGPLQLQWRATLGTTFTNIPGATNSILTLTNVQVTNRRFAAVVTNLEGAVTSRLAVLTVLRPPQFSLHPASAVVVDGTGVSLSVTTTGSTPIEYQWFFNGVAIEGETGPSVYLPGLTASAEGDYWVTASNIYGSSTSRVARVSVIPAPSSLEPRVFTGVPGLSLPYRLFVPQAGASGSGPAALYPLVLFLHGAGERGTDNFSQVANWPQAMVFISHANQSRFPLLFVAPQCPVSKTWSDPDMLRALPLFLAALGAEFPVDTNRLYVTGLSLGGIGSWDLLRVRPTLFAAAIPQSGAGDPTQVNLFKDVPIWNFHSASDSTVPVTFSQEMIQALRVAGGRPIYTEYASGGHGIWGQAYATPGLVEWTLAQRRGVGASVPPDIRIQSPAPDGSSTPVPVATNRVSIAGHVRTLWDTPTTIRWYNYTTHASGAAGSTFDWAVDGVGPLLGGVNRIGVVASTYSFAPVLGGVTMLSDSLDLDDQAPIRVVASREGELLRIDWPGGGDGTFYLETAADIAKPAWGSRVPLLQPSVTLPIAAGNAYFRIVRE
ncbi:MAG TPA: hypothetical protein DCM86_05040 [Verrucomicrobiales bacterium]|nr:hypothetical protein [Verrucomicrobiales bacterium]